jgi:hypothetical protein
MGRGLSSTFGAEAVAAGASADSVTGALVGFEKSSDAGLYTDGFVFTSLSISFTALGLRVAAAVGAAAGAATGTVADAVSGASVVAGKSVDADFTSLLVLCVFSDTTVTAVAADAVAGALGGIGMSDDAVLDTGGVPGADFFSLLVSFVFSDKKIAAATGAAADAVTGALVVAGMSSEVPK